MQILLVSVTNGRVEGGEEKQRRSIDGKAVTATEASHPEKKKKKRTSRKKLLSNYSFQSLSVGVQ